MIINPYSFFNPIYLSPALWLDGSDASTLYDATTGGSLVAADGAIARWEDKSGNARHATQGTLASRPLRKTAIANGRDVVRFDGSNDFFSIPSSTAYFKFLHDGTESSVFMVVKSGTAANPDDAYALLANNGTSATQIGVGIFYDDRASETRNNAYVASITRGVISSFVADCLSQNVWTPNQFASVYTRFSGSAAAADRIITRINGGTELKTNVDTNAVSTANATSDMIIGAANGAAVLPTLGDISEILIYPTAISNTERQSVETYLNNKWAIY